MQRKAGSPASHRDRVVVVRRYPFTIRLKDRVGGEVQPVRVKIDPGSKTTGIAVVTDEDGNKPAKVLCLFELSSHRGRQISEALTARRAFQRRRRGANLRYRALRFANRRKLQGWLAPSLRHRIDTCMSWVERLRRVVAVTGIALERVRFDTQLLEKPEISDVAYQQGLLAGYAVREYFLEKFDRACAYCGVCNGRVAVRASGSFTVGNADAINATYCKILHRADRYGYGWRPALPPRAKPPGFQRGGF